MKSTPVCKKLKKMRQDWLPYLNLANINFIAQNFFIPGFQVKFLFQ